MAASLAQDALAQLWLRPAWFALETLTADRPHVVGLSADPGAILHLVRNHHARPLTQFACDFHNWTRPILCAQAARLLAADAAHYSDWTRSVCGARLLHTGRRIATVAARLATDTGLTSPAAAWATGLLTPLGWYSLCAANPNMTELPAESRGAVQTLTRRLTVRQRLPDWLAIPLDWLTLSTQDAVQLGADAGLFAIVQAAVNAVEQADPAHRLFVEIPTEVLNPTLIAPAAELCKAQAVSPKVVPTATDSARWSIPPSTLRVMVRLLQSTAQLREATQARDPLEMRFDQLASFVDGQQRTLTDRVQDARLMGLAEFAAGASHEINNPLMIILGNSRILAEEEVDADRIARFASIARSTHRISDLLAKTRLFARPPVPRPEPIHLTDWLATVSEEWERMAAEHSVRFHGEPAPTPIPVIAFDPNQLRQTLTQLIQNAVEAAGSGGWVRLRWQEATTGNAVQIAVEDSGPGPDAEIRDQLFDPFFCGRTAGRHPGLGLSVAWRLVQQNGGKLRYAPTAAQPGRFVLHLPACADQNSVIRKSA